MSRVYYAYKNGGMVVTGCDLDYEGEVSISSGIVGIEPNAFRYCSKITSVTIPSSVTSIGEYAFCECTSLTNINIPAITTIPVGCFKGCKSLESVDFNNVTTIGDYAFAECSSFNMVLPTTITSVGIRAFHHTGITNLSISENLSSIGDGAFCWCPLESISINSNNTNYIIEDDVLYNTDKTELILYPPFKTDTTFTIPETVTRINKYAFEENYYMEKIRINDAMVTLEGLCGLMNIKEFECYNSEGIVSQTANGYRVLVNQETSKGYLFYNEYLCRVPVDETSLDGCSYSFSGCLSGAFAGCNLLTTLNSSYTYGISGYKEILRYKCFYKCSSINDNININLGYVSGIDDYAFAECENIASISLVTSSSSISDFTFYGYAFYNCSKINTISINVNTYNIITKTHSFENCQQLNVLSFPYYSDSTDITSEKNSFLNTANTQSTLQYEVFNNQLVGIFGIYNGQIKTPVSDNKTIWKIWKSYPNIYSIVLGEGMTKLMGYTFCNKSYSKQGWYFNDLQHIKFPSTLTEIGGYAFYKTSLNMLAVDFSACKNITTVEPFAFYEVQNINIDLENLRYVGNHAFGYSTFRTPINININDDNSLIVYERCAFECTLGLNNINISCSDIYVGKCLSNISLNNNLCDFTSIDYYNNVGSITNISLSNSGTGCTFCGQYNKEYSSLKNVSIISKNSYFYGGQNFSYNYNLETLALQSENQLYTNSDSNYSYCYNLKDVIISGSVNGNDFANCYNLQKVKFYKMLSSTNYINPYSFYMCYTINTLDFSESGLTEINMNISNSNYAPFGRSPLFCLKDLILPDNLTSLTIAGMGFKGKNFKLPKNLRTLTIDACPALSEIDIPSSVTNITFIGYSTYGHSIRKLKVPNGCVVNNGYYMLYGNKIPIKITHY